MRKAIKQIGACAVLLLLFCLACRLIFFRTYTAYIPLHKAEEESFRREGVLVEVEEPDTVRVGESEVEDGYMRIRLEPEHGGEADIIIHSGDGETAVHVPLRISPFRTVYNLSTGDFTGDSVVLIAVTLFWMLVSAIMVWHFSRARGTSFYSYGTVYYAGFSLFAMVTGLVALQITVSHLADPAETTMLRAYTIIRHASSRFMNLTAPLMIFFALAMVVSNIELLRHEHLGLQNVLGLLAGFLLLAGEALGWFLYTRDFTGSEMQGRVHNTLENTYATVFVYFECMLAGAAICSLLAARHEPVPDKDFIIILGCWFRKDGSLPPLLQGRAERALEFWEKQVRETGREAVFIPSGGQGRDEPMPEGEAIRNYLQGRGVPDRLILPETRAANTYQNMLYAREIMEKKKVPAKAVYATTNYHVFRSGVWAAEAGLAAEGIGGKTKWWYWPNAFLRETAGLLHRRWKQELFFLLVMIVYFSLLTLVVG